MNDAVLSWYRTWIKGWFTRSSEKARQAKKTSDDTRKEADKLKLLLAELRSQNGN